MKLTLIRHGITYGNKYGLYYGATDLPLLEEGIAPITFKEYPREADYLLNLRRRINKLIADKMQ